MPTTLSRSLLVVLLPGLVAVAPWLLALVQHTNATLGLNTYPTLGNGLLFATAAIVGSVFEGLASHLEVRWDIEREDAYSVSESWYAYLGNVVSPEPVGYRYLSRLATTMYFELAMLFAGPLFVLGGALLAALRFREFAAPIVVSGAVVAIGSAIYFRWQARCTHETLCKTRRELVRRARYAASAPGPIQGT